MCRSAFIWSDAVQKKKVFFFEKKKQKTFAWLSRTSQESPAIAKQKFFGPFFQKRTACLIKQISPAAIALINRPHTDHLFYIGLARG
jgi:hypothetical protein